MTSNYSLCPADVGWIGKIPDHWRLLPARVAVRNMVTKNDGAKDQNYLSLVAGRGVIPYADKGDMGNKKPDDLGKCKLVRRGNIVLNSMNFFIGAYGMSSYDGVCSPVYIVLDVLSRRIYPKFALYVFGVPGFQTYLATFGDGILKHRAAIGWDDIKGRYLPIPPLEEQTQIAKFLDYEIAKIDALIEKQQQLIALLKEKRQAVISHAVTKGLDPTAPMKDSGVEWLGKVPAHWEMSQLGHLSHEVTVGIVVTPASYYVDSGVPCLRSLNVGPGYLRKENLVYISRSSNELLRKSRIYEGDVVVVRTGQPGTAAKVDSSLDSCNCIDLIIVRRSQHLESDFLVYQLNSEFSTLQITAGSGGAIQQHFNVGVAKKLKVLRPPLDEQKRVVEYLRRHTAALDELLDKAARKVTLLQERRTALISAAVTGKIDVRGWTPPPGWKGPPGSAPNSPSPEKDQVA